MSWSWPGVSQLSAKRKTATFAKNDVVVFRRHTVHARRSALNMILGGADVERPMLDSVQRTCAVECEEWPTEYEQLGDQRQRVGERKPRHP